MNNFPAAPPVRPLHTDPLFAGRKSFGQLLARVVTSGPVLLAVALFAWVLLPVLVVLAGFFPCITDSCPARVATPLMTLCEHLLWADGASFLAVAGLSIAAIVKKNLPGFAIAALVLTALPAFIELHVIIGLVVGLFQ